MNERIRDFRDLEVWKKCRDIRVSIWNLCKTFPSEERYRLSDQTIRSSRSAPACIAEGYGRFHYQENIQFCRQARGSLYELIDHLSVALECEYITRATEAPLSESVLTAIKQLNGYINYLRRKKQSDKE